jgi:hypothetical protein
MKSLRVLLVHEGGSVRSALASALASAGHEVRIAEGHAAAQKNDPAVDAVVYDESLSAVVLDAPRRIGLQRPVNMEELRRALRQA